MSATLTVLIVDDDDLVRETVRRIVEREGHMALEAENGKAAIQMVDALDVDLVLTDIFMPEMDGIELITRLRRSHPRLRLAAMSGGGIVPAREILRVAHSLGVASVLEKPFGADDVRAELEATVTERFSPDEGLGLGRGTG